MGIPNISQTPNSVKSAFLRVHFELRFEHEAGAKGTQYLKLEMRWGPTPKVILVPHAIPNNLAVSCFAQLPLYKKLQPNFQIGA